ncbi:microtubule-associated protein TORTIFOLIA1 [Pyrus ussuriensis x Pyrus communis]|uniref:Microtubule-associated protein TORTIFOLIA1 n=1 Tax=Pyrus ussuriensis x Pyrus communis TaxID=2448454 RepID=A0A5N5HYZ5_9ROSA|nr:microtubule-associated protein TORTIFOLIA1 [Pyrus ussuriensis x Pyrus communis]
MGVQIHNLSLSSPIILIISAASLQLLAESKTFWADIEALKEFKNSLNPDSIGSALCLAGAIDSAPDPDPVQLKRSLQRLGKLAKSESFKAKAALLVLVGAGGASSQGTLDWLVPCGVEFLSSEDWTVRKAAAEALGKVATVETDLAPFYKASCLNALESRRFDKVKVVRETMNQALELWKVLLAGDSEEIPAPIQSRSSTDNGIGRCSPPSLKSSDDPGFRTPQPKKTVPTNRSPPSDASLVTTAKKGNPLSRSDRNPDTAVLHLQALAASAPPPWLLPLNVINKTKPIAKLDALLCLKLWLFLHLRHGCRL